MTEENDEHRKFVIEDVVDETPTIKTFRFKMDSAMEKLYAGQFMMAWIPGVGEKPFTVSGFSYSPPMFDMTVRRIDPKSDEGKEQGVGKFTQAMHVLEPSDVIFARGPYGKGFEYNAGSKSIVVVGGGCGVAALGPISKRRCGEYIKGLALLGATTKDELFFENGFRDSGFDVHVSTDDGSYGQKGFVTDLLESADIPEGSDFYICGPEEMMKKAAEIASGYTDDDNIQLAVERYMKCAVGICGQCECGGSRVCVNGPVYTWSKLKDNPDFGIRKRNKMGRYIQV